LQFFNFSFDLSTVIIVSSNISKYMALDVSMVKVSTIYSRDFTHILSLFWGTCVMNAPPGALSDRIILLNSYYRVTLKEADACIIIWTSTKSPILERIYFETALEEMSAKRLDPYRKL
jgi:hypothetical protein